MVQKIENPVVLAGFLFVFPIFYSDKKLLLLSNKYNQHGL